MDCPRRVPVEGERHICADCFERMNRALRRAQREHMSWNYRVVKYAINGETLVGLMEVYYDEKGVPNGYAAASVLHWESMGELWEQYS